MSYFLLFLRSDFIIQSSSVYSLKCDDSDATWWTIMIETNVDKIIMLSSKLNKLMISEIDFS